MTIVEFLTARLADPVGQGDPDLNCDGVGEYYRCHEWSEWHRRTVEEQRKVLSLHSGENDEQCQSWAGNWIYEPCATLKALASVYSEHPDYQQEWKP